jgi:hypothetical protein
VSGVSTRGGGGEGAICFKKRIAVVTGAAMGREVHRSEFISANWPHTMIPAASRAPATEPSPSFGSRFVRLESMGDWPCFALMMMVKLGVRPACGHQRHQGNTLQHSSKVRINTSLK